MCGMRAMEDKSEADREGGGGETGLPFAPRGVGVTMCCMETRSKPKIGLNSVHFLIKH